MAGFTQARQQAILDSELAAGDYLAFSANGTSETGSLARAAVGGWGSATAASPSVKSNTSAITSPTASAGVTISHSAVYSAVTAGTQKTDWEPIKNAGTPTPRALLTGDALTLAVGAVAVSLD